MLGNAGVCISCVGGCDMSNLVDTVGKAAYRCMNEHGGFAHGSHVLWCPRCRAELEEALAAAVQGQAPSLDLELACQGCGGPHPFDTSVPSVRWNAVVRAKGLPEFLCLTCIVKAFADTGESFTATLTGCGFRGLPIEVVVNGETSRDARLIQQENNALRWKIRELEDGHKQAAQASASQVITVAAKATLYPEAPGQASPFKATFGNEERVFTANFEGGQAPPSPPPVVKGDIEKALELLRDYDKDRTKRGYRAHAKINEARGFLSLALVHLADAPHKAKRGVQGPAASPSPGKS